MFEDMSTLGGDWDNQTMDESQVTKGDGGGSVATGDMDEDDIEADQQRYLKENEMIVEGLRCPDEYLNHLTPMEFEEIVNMFLKFDADGSGTIDKHEVKKILTFLGMEASIKMAQELIDVIDVDQSGEIDFQEFCGFIVLLKKGDPRLGGFGSMLNMLNSTPLGELEKQCATRGLRISFQVVEKRESTLTHPTCWIVQVILVGNFHSIVEGEVVATMGTRKYQGLGPTTKEAKYNAASNAIINLGESMPGVRCKPGEFPEEWLQWLDENLLRGVDPGKAVGILASKGFYPHRNTFLMHRVLVWAALDRFQARFPDIELCDPDTPLHEEFFEWCKACAKKGYDGTVIVKLLEDRGIDLRSHYNHFAQQLENNELGCLMDKNGAEANILDFWYAAKMGYLEDVLIFCKCNVQLNEERVDRHTSERMTALVYAAQYGHSECIKVMLQYGADPRTVDLRGRTPVHHAAMKGHTAACSFLIDGGGMMFSGDIQGNTPLHLAALNNHFETVNYLAFKGLELTRLMTSDKVKVKASHTFDQLCEEVFALMPTKKLTTADTVRLEKVWLCDCANYFISRMDMSVRHMLAPCCPEIQADVLARFDHRPESGVFLTGVNGEPELIKTIANPGDLSLLLKYVFRQTALDNINTWKRTPLHLACDANHINSHEKLILRMIDFHGCNTSMKDMHGRRPIDLLIKDKFMQNMPSATQVREELIIDRRETLIDGMFRQFKQQDLIHTIAQRKAIVDECVGEVRKMTLRLWHCYREGSIARAAFGQGWEMYEDPDTNNFFYCKKPAKPMMGETYSDYGWSEPPRAKALIDRTCALTYLTRVRSTLLRTFEQWQQYREKRTQIDFFYHVLTRDITFVTPKHLGWRYILKERTPERAMRKLGYGNEWEEFQDKYSNTFYRNTITRVCEYDRPADAVSVTPADMLCSAYQYNGKATMQEVYSCEQCNRAWKQSPEGTSSVRICGACVARCHVGHKGVRLVRYALALCMCTDVCRVTQCQCRAMQISQAQIDVQVGAMAAREELARHRKRNQEEPPVFAMVPRYDRDGELKGESGWLICRLCNSPDTESANQTEEEEEKLMIDDGGASDEDSMMSEATATFSMASLDSIVRATEQMENPSTYAQLPSVGTRASLPAGWYEVYDVEEPAQLKYPDRVLCQRYLSLLKQYGHVKAEVKAGFFKIRFEDRSIPDEVLERSYLELCSRGTFYGNISEGTAAWTTAEANNDPIASESLTLTGPDWQKLYREATIRRSFSQWEEYMHPFTDQIFYVHSDNLAMERAILQVQNVYRRSHCKKRPHAPFRSVAFTFDVPGAVQGLKEDKMGWAYLRRRSTNVGDIQDSEGVEWEEYMDKKTSEYFYWNEDENLYRWDKPVAQTRTLVIAELFKVEEEVMYIFPGRRIEEVAVIMRVRFDDETGADMYDITSKYNKELAFKWIARMHIKHVPKEGDALMLAKMETKWKQQLRRKREADDRKAKRDKELAVIAEMLRLEEMKSMAFKLGLMSENTLSQNTRILRGRIRRAELEEQEIREEIDISEGQARRDRVTALMAETRLKQKNLTRSEVLTMTRGLELKLVLEEKVLKRNVLRKDLIAKKQQSLNRNAYVEETLRGQEVQTTTPRSMVRRRIIRRMHIAMKRQEDNFMICEWGCGDWFRVGKDQTDHQLRRCVRRILGCTLDCPLKHTEEHWLEEYESEGSDLEEEEIFYGGSEARARTPALGVIDFGTVTNQQHHEQNECPKRLVMCPKQCLEWVCAEVLQKHIDEQCTKRPAKPIECRNGCGQIFGGNVEMLIQAEDERLRHETEECDLRIVRCNWTHEDGTMCAAQMPANDREEHRDYHLTLQGMMTYSVPGTYLYRVPKKLTRLKVQLWGSGGGSGFFRGRQGGAGGGGAFVEAIIQVEPYSVLELVVGSGGGAGVPGSDVETVEIDAQREIMAVRRAKEIHLLQGAKMDHDDDEASLAVIAQSCGVTLGGHPGGGEGYGGSGRWSSGGGGGYTIISKRTNKGNQALVVAAGGGGGGSVPGLSGGALEGSLAGIMLDPVNGITATVDTAGAAGDSGSTYNAAWPATYGDNWQGGNGCEFGAGGGGGYYGGGGGGTVPGISGAGGGGSSYLYMNIAFDKVIMPGHGVQPGGLNHNPPLACGVGEWNKVGGWAGQGGMADAHKTNSGNNGAIRLIKPGFY